MNMKINIFNVFVYMVCAATYADIVLRTLMIYCTKLIGSYTFQQYFTTLKFVSGFLFLSPKVSLMN